MIRIFILLLVLLAGHAEAYSGRELLEDCRAAESFYQEQKPGDTSQPIQAARCLAYLSGFADGYEVGDYLAGKVGVQLNAFCLPTGEDAQLRLVRAVLAHIGNQPPNTAASSRTLVAGALSKAFPCSPPQ